MITDNYLVSYAQNGEDLIVAGFFPDIEKGFYVDVGANHPIRHSVTKILYDKGWHGINIEPNIDLFKQIEKHRPNDINLNIGIAGKEGSLELRVYHSRDGLAGLSTFTSEIKEEYAGQENEDTKNFTDVVVKTTSLAQLFKSQKVDTIHFLKVDVEGFENEVLRSNDWKKYRPILLCIESNHLVNDWHDYLKEQKYTVVFNDGLNDYLLANEELSRREKFDYAKTMLLDKPVINSDLAEVLEGIEKRVNYSEHQYNIASANLSKLEQDYDKLIAERNELTWTLQQYNSISRLARALAGRLHRRILFSINKLQQPAGRSRVRHMSITNIPEHTVDELLDASSSYDKKYLRSRSVYTSPRFYAYLLLIGGYRGATKLAKFIFKALRKIKRMGR